MSSSPSGCHLRCHAWFEALSRLTLGAFGFFESSQGDAGTSAFSAYGPVFSAVAMPLLSSISACMLKCTLPFAPAFLVRSISSRISWAGHPPSLGIVLLVKLPGQRFRPDAFWLIHQL